MEKEYEWLEMRSVLTLEAFRVAFLHDNPADIVENVPAVGRQDYHRARRDEAPD